MDIEINIACLSDSQMEKENRAQYSHQAALQFFLSLRQDIAFLTICSKASKVLKCYFVLHAGKEAVN